MKHEDLEVGRTYITRGGEEATVLSKEAGWYHGTDQGYWSESRAKRGVTEYVVIRLRKCLRVIKTEALLRPRGQINRCSAPTAPVVHHAVPDGEAIEGLWE